MDLNINYPQLKSIVNKHKFSNGTGLEFNNYIYHVFITQQTREDQQRGYEPAFWKSGSTIGDFDIYLPEKIFSKRVIISFRRPILFHEIAESYLCGVSLEKDIQQRLTESHDIARK